MRHTDAGGRAAETAAVGAVPDLVPARPRAALRVRVGVGAAVVLVVVALVASVLITALSPVGATTLVAPGPGGVAAASGAVAAASPAAVPPDATPADAPSTGAPLDVPVGSAGTAPPSADPVAAFAGSTLMVHILGAVAHPGVFALPAGSRAIDAVALAGGLTDAADQSSVNLARPLLDGEQLRILAVGEVPPPPAPGAAPAGSAGTGSTTSGAPASGAPASGAGAAGAPAGAAASPPTALVNLNTATTLDLDTLPRIGPATADHIIAWRTDNGPFATVDDLLQIPGIGDKTLAAFRDRVTV